MTITVAGRKVGPGYPPIVSAEVGLNHNGDLDLALRTIDAAADAGCDAVKFQAYRVEEFLDTEWDTIDGDTWTYTSQGKQITKNKWDMFRRHQMDSDFLLATKRHAEQRGLIWHATPTSPAGVQMLVEMGAPVLKNGSDMLQNYELILAMAKTGLPIVMSTTHGIWPIVDAMAKIWLANIKIPPILPCHCVRTYPCPIEQANLRRLVEMPNESVYEFALGYSDHTEGIAAAVIAVQLGACWIEKHFTLDRNLPGPDHAFSADPHEMRELVKACKAVPR